MDLTDRTQSFLTRKESSGMNLIKRTLVVATLLLALVLQATPAQQPQQQRDMSREAAERIASSILVGGQSMSYVTELSDTFGGRLTGTAAYERSAQWAAAKFRAAGIKDVKMEAFTIPNGWERGWARARIVAPLDRPLHLESLGWSPSTPPGGVRGEVMLLTETAPEKLKEQAEKIRGRIVMVNSGAIFSTGLAGFARFLATIPLIKEAGALALMMTDSEANNVLNAFGLTWGAETSPLPVGQIGMEDTRLIGRLMEKGPVSIEFQFTNRNTGPTQVNNVIAEIRGREKPDEWIIIGAHLDSWDYGTGAQDNGTGCAMVFEAARAIAALGGGGPRRSIRFALWGGEEQGLLGSAAYVKAHAAELDNCVAVLNTDNGAGHPRGWKVQGRSDLGEALKPISRSLLAGLSGDGISQNLSYDTDHGPFMIEGIPALDLWVDMRTYDPVHHKTSDTVDKIDAHNLAAGSAIVAVTAYMIAERPERVAPRLDHAAVETLLNKAKLIDFLKSINAWK
jgi:carboxypeptidase Q